jgi:proteic killer suppression protein
MNSIGFKSRKLADVFNSEKELKRKYGERVGRLIKRRMAVLRAAAMLADVSHKPPERRHELEGRRKGTFAVDLKHPHRLVFKPDHNPLPCKEGGGIDLRKVTAIIILGVEDYH